MLRLGSRAGAHPRGFLLGAVASTDAAALELRARWGIPVEAGEVKFVRRHDRVMGTVKKDGKTILDCALIDPQPVAGTDVQYINWVTAANAPLDGTTQPMLIQVDPKYTFYKAERGKPQVNGVRAGRVERAAIELADADRRHLLHRRHRPAPHPLRDGSAQAGLPGHAPDPREPRATNSFIESFTSPVSGGGVSVLRRGMATEMVRHAPSVADDRDTSPGRRGR